MQSLITLFVKDLRHEVRTRAAVTFIVTLSLLMSVVLAIGINAAFLTPQVLAKIFPCLIWIVFFLTATIVLGKSFDSETEHRALEGLLLAGVSPSTIYLSKVASSLLVALMGHIISLLSLSMLLNVSIFSVAGSLLILSIMVISVYASLTALTVPIANSSKAKSLLLPLILLPLLFPAFFAALELSFIIFSDGNLDFSSFWLSLLLGLDVIYITLGLNLYQYVIQSD